MYSGFVEVNAKYGASLYYYFVESQSNPKTDPVVLWLQGGPQYSANVNMIDKNRILKSGRDIIKEGNFNLVGGLWIQFGGKAPLLRVNMGIRYISGIGSMSNLETITGSKQEWKNQMIQLHIGINY